MTVLVTGGAGFIGANFIREWHAIEREPLVNLDLLTYAGNLSNLESVEGQSGYHFVRGDIADLELVASLLDKFKPRAVVNFAAESHVDRSIHGPAEFIRTNIVGTFHLLQATLAYWDKLGSGAQEQFRLVHVSTDEVYGSLGSDEPAFTEQHRFEPNSPYSASKAASDHLVRSFNQTYGLPVLTSNCSNNYGPYQFPEKLIPLVIHNALAGKALPIYGDGQQVRDWLYVADHCSAIREILKSGVIGDVYNIGGNSEKTNISVVEFICDLLDAMDPADLPLSVQKRADSYRNLIEFVRDRPGHDRRYAIDSSHIQSALGWEPRESFESGMRKTLSWYLKNQSWVLNVTSGAYRDWVTTQYA